MRRPRTSKQGGQLSMSLNVSGMFGPGGAGGRRKERRTMSVADARPLLEEAEAEEQFPAEMLAKEAVRGAGVPGSRRMLLRMLLLRMLLFV